MKTTDNKTAPVDVLAEMQQAYDTLKALAFASEMTADHVQAEAMLEARAAVAELIEANEEYDEAWRDMAGRTHTASRREKAGLRRAAALARVKGEAA